MCWYFEIKITNVYTRESEIIYANYITNISYFEAWNKCIERAKERIDEKEKPFHWFISSVRDVTAR